jgi:hypothetical protein
VYREWLALTRPAGHVSPDGTRRPRWLMRPLKPSEAAFALPEARAQAGSALPEARPQAGSTLPEDPG